MYVPGVMACSAHVETGDTVVVSVAVEQPGVNGGWGIGMTRGTVLQGSQTGKGCISLASGHNLASFFTWSCNTEFHELKQHIYISFG